MSGENLIPAAELPTLFPGTDVQFWAQLRHRGTGPAYVKVVRRVYYERAAIDDWIRSNTFVRPDRPVNAE